MHQLRSRPTRARIAMMNCRSPQPAIGRRASRAARFCHREPDALRCASCTVCRAAKHCEQQEGRRRTGKPNCNMANGRSSCGRVAEKRYTEFLRFACSIQRLKMTSNESAKTPGFAEDPVRPSRPTNARSGEEIYRSLRETLEDRCYGSYVMINTETEEYVLGSTTSEAHANFMERFGAEAPGWCTRIGVSVFATL
jgi:hypothetical protein